MDGWVGFFIVFIIIVCIVGALSGGKNFGEVIAEGIKGIFAFIIVIAVGIAIYIGVSNKNAEKKEEEAVATAAAKAEKEHAKSTVMVCFYNLGNIEVEGYVIWPSIFGSSEKICNDKFVRLPPMKDRPVGIPHLVYTCTADSPIESVDGPAFFYHKWPEYKADVHKIGQPAYFVSTEYRQNDSCLEANTFTITSDAKPGYSLNFKKGRPVFGHIYNSSNL